MIRRHSGKLATSLVDGFECNRDVATVTIDGGSVRRFAMRIRLILQFCLIPAGLAPTLNGQSGVRTSPLLPALKSLWPSDD